MGEHILATYLQQILRDGLGLSETSIGMMMMLMLRASNNIKFKNVFKYLFLFFIRQLGFKSGIPTVDSFFGPEFEEFAMDNVTCTGLENNLQDCQYNIHREYTQIDGAGVICGR